MRGRNSSPAMIASWPALPPASDTDWWVGGASLHCSDLHMADVGWGQISHAQIPEASSPTPHEWGQGYCAASQDTGPTLLSEHRNQMEEGRVSSLAHHKWQGTRAESIFPLPTLTHGRQRVQSHLSTSYNLKAGSLVPLTAGSAFL